MRILNEENVEITLKEVNPELGYLINDKIFVKHHEAVAATPPVVHYEVFKIYFEDGTFLEITDQNDPHIIIIDRESGIFDYQNVGTESKTMRGMDLLEVVDTPAVEAKEAYDEYEDIQRYKIFTPEQLEERKRAQQTEQFLSSGPGRLDSTETQIADLTILMAEMTGM